MWIDLEALEHNVRTLRAQVGPETHIIGALKGNAYGHGAGPVARRLARLDVQYLSTGSLEDALAIREAGVELPILIFGGALPESLPLLVEHGLTPTVYSQAGAEAVSRAAARPTAVWVKVDAGLGRLGVPIEQALAFIEHIARLDRLVVEGVYTHLSFHDRAGRDWARERLAAFDAFLESLHAAGIDVPIAQALASSGLIAGLASRANAVCPGHLLYGLSPVEPEVAGIGPYRPVLRAITSRLIHVGTTHDAAPGLGDSAPRRIGVLPLGLADGYRPIVAPGASTLIAGRRAPIRGVSLEHMVLDLSDLADTSVGDEVVLLGRSGDGEITLGDLAAWQGTRPHQVLMAFDRRLPCRYL
jgi:alanine racemase